MMGCRTGGARLFRAYPSAGECFVIVVIGTLALTPTAFSQNFLGQNAGTIRDARGTTAIAGRILRGESAAAIPVRHVNRNRFIFDWRQLRPWGIPESALPPDSEIRFRKLTAWNQLKPWILPAVAIFGLHTLLIGGLLAERRRRQTGTAALGRAEQELRESEERFRNMADTAPVMIWVSSPDMRCTFCNRGWLAFTGRTLEQELGDGWIESVHPEDLGRCRADWAAAFRDRRNYQLEFRLRRVDGEYRWVLSTGVPRFQEKGSFAGYVGSCLDITAFKRAREEAVAGQKLESMGLLASAIAHDFNNLLGGILASTDLALASLAESSDAYRELLRTRTAAIRGAEIVRQLMVYGGNESPAFESVDLSVLVGEMVHLLKVSISKYAILKTEFGEGLPPVQANPAQIRQVVMNLVINASEAIEREGQIRIATTLVPLRDSSSTRSGSLPVGDYLQLEVSHTGRGMTEEARARIFDPFYTTKATGRGLALAVVQEIVRGHGGAINIASSPGQGTTFQVLLLCKGRQESAAQPIPPAVVARPSRATGTILFVEDEDALREPVTTMLRRTGFTVIEAGDGRTALDLFRANGSNIDVVLLDMTLPGCSGREVLAELQLMQPDVTVVITSAYGPDSIMKSLQGLRSGPFIRKPYQVRQLITLLRSLTAQAGTSSQAVG